MQFIGHFREYPHDYAADLEMDYRLVIAGDGWDVYLEGPARQPRDPPGAPAPSTELPMV